MRTFIEQTINELEEQAAQLLKRYKLLPILYKNDLENSCWLLTAANMLRASL